MKNLILIVGCLLVFIPCQAAEQKEQNQWQAEDIENYISRQRHNIENYYKGQLVELNQRAESELLLLETTDAAIYASLAAQAEVAKTVLNIDSYGYLAPWYLASETERMLELKDDGDFEDGITKSPKRFAVAQSLMAERKSRILANLEWETVKLEQRKQYALTAGLERLEKRLKENLLKPKPEVTHGMVIGILYSSDKSSAIIDGKMVHEGDTINGVTVVKIFRDKVVFEKKGKGWDQKVQEKPASYWK